VEFIGAAAAFFAIFSAEQSIFWCFFAGGRKPLRAARKPTIFRQLTIIFIPHTRMC